MIAQNPQMQPWISLALRFEEVKMFIAKEAKRLEVEPKHLDLFASKIYEEFFEKNSVRQSRKTVLQYYNMLRFWRKNSDIDPRKCIVGFSVLQLLRAIKRLDIVFQNDHKTSKTFAEITEKTFKKNESPTKEITAGVLTEIKHKYGAEIADITAAKKMFDITFYQLLKKYGEELPQDDFYAKFKNKLIKEQQKGGGKMYTEQLQYMIDNLENQCHMRRLQMTVDKEKERAEIEHTGTVIALDKMERLVKAACKSKAGIGILLGGNAIH